MARLKEFDVDVAIDEAVELFWRHGYERTSLTDLLDHLQIGRASFYNAFGDKHALFMLALRRYFEITDEVLIIQNLKNNPPSFASIEAIFQQLSDVLATDCQHRGCLIVNAAIDLAPNDKEVAAFIEDYAQRCENALYDALRHAHAANEIRQDLDLRAAARFLMATIQGMRVTARMSHDRRLFEDIANMALSTLRKA